MIGSGKHFKNNCIAHVEEEMPLFFAEIKLEKAVENKFKLRYDTWQFIKIDTLLFGYKPAFVFCCFFKFYFTQVCWYKRNDNTS